ncbi:hypothetical protein COEREDRAFT_90516 [Coemansia reversa NRRL 1564]|uniref:Uncharacterized protein n=1 Tax=Coemansia reversa (strain ATCC 12441 / NRRL 1564) TaxID=763665 RepID=A0A2G5BJL8_COERN|nr:hypothetical protein COEREDRAFT_90516 [Coemansia reversa NRRL 1564]|eukprot:PIA19172.1 hypothetical protein COEREDRAFT_90516 [Coemansia reversa NRRL 1564]
MCCSCRRLELAERLSYDRRSALLALMGRQIHQRVTPPHTTISATAHATQMRVFGRRRG